MQKAKLAQNFLIIITLIGFVFVGQIAGNALQQSFQERQYLLESLSAEELGGIQAYTPQFVGGVLIENWRRFVSQECKDDVYYTSLPAKCQSIGGRLIEVGNNEPNIILLPSLNDLEE